MTNEEKAMEIVNCNKCSYNRNNCKHNKDTWCHEYRMALEMAQWKDAQIRETIEDLPKIKGWIARDKTYDLHFFSKKPKRNIADSRFNLDNVWIGKNWLVLDCDLYPKLTWEDEPIEVEITIKHYYTDFKQSIEETK